MKFLRWCFSPSLWSPGSIYAIHSSGSSKSFKKIWNYKFLKKYYNIQNFSFFFSSQNMLIWHRNKIFWFKKWFWRRKKLTNLCHHFSTFLRFWALVINFDKINCYKMKWWTVEIIKQPCFVMYDLYFCHFKTYKKLHSALRHPVNTNCTF